MLAQLRATLRAVLALPPVRIAIGLTAVTSGLSLLAQINEELAERRTELVRERRELLEQLKNGYAELEVLETTKARYPAAEDVDPLRIGLAREQPGGPVAFVDITEPDPAA